jgi:hypothetical protein
MQLSDVSLMTALPLGQELPPDTQAEVNPSVQHKDPVKKESQQGCRKVKARPVLQYLR